MSLLSAEERMLERALAARGERKQQASLRGSTMKRIEIKNKEKVALSPQASSPAVVPTTSPPLDVYTTKKIVKLPPEPKPVPSLPRPHPTPDDKQQEDKYDEEDFESDEDDYSSGQSDVFESDEEVNSRMPLDSDGLPCLIRLMSMRSLDEDETDSDADDEKEERGADERAVSVYATETLPPLSLSLPPPLHPSAVSSFQDSHQKLLSPIRGKARDDDSSHDSSLTHSRSGRDNTVLDGVQVRKYFGRKARVSFFNKVHWMNRQHVMHDVSSDLLPLAASSPNSVITSATSTTARHSRRNASKASRNRQKIPLKLSPRQRGKSRGDIQTLQDLVGVGKQNRQRKTSMSSLDSISSLGSLRSGVSITNETQNQLVFDDHNDLDADIYVNHEEYQEGLCLDIENLLNHLTEQKGEKNKSSLILETMYKREEASNAVINRIRAKTPDVSVIPHQGYGLSEVQSSPRSMYIASCISHRLNPRASHVIRKGITQELHLEHFGMGDDMAEQLAQGIKELPMLYYINISDNNLTDRGMKVLLASVTHMPMLYVLNMSDNTIGAETACALQSFLNSEAGCPLQSLILKNANVDDYEGAMFIRSLHNNTTLTELDMSKNLIGDAEILNSVRPDLITAMECLADLIRSEECRLQSIVLAWNNIRLESAVYFAQALCVNTTLLHLDLSYNSLADQGGRAMGEALLHNKTLRTLLLSNNNIGPAASFIICTAVEQNTSLRQLVLDNNPIGESGASAVMNLPNVVGSRLMISAAECNVSLREANGWFDESDPCRKYKLNMTDAYERAIAYKLLTICAHHHSYEFVTFTHEESKKIKPVKIDLEQRLLRGKIKFLTKKEKKMLSNLYKVKDAAKDVTLAQRLFEEFDVDHSGEIDMSELGDLLKCFGMSVKKDMLSSVMSIIDVDGSGGIELPEFLNFIRDHQDDAMLRIKEMTELPTMVRKGTLTKYTPPKTGTLVIELRDNYVKKKNFQVITSSDQKNITKLASLMGTGPAQMISFSFRTSKMRLAEAFEFYEAMIYDVGDKAKVLAKILPHMVVPTEARQLVSKVTLDDPIEVNFVRNMLGNALRPIFGLPCGYYRLEFSKDVDRICLAKLFELEGVVMSLRRDEASLGKGVVGDTSQYRNWSFFRNGLYNGAPIKIKAAGFTPIPKTGVLEFDFTGSMRPKCGQVTMTDIKFTKVLINLALLDVSNTKGVLEELRYLTAGAEEAMEGSGKVHFECNRLRAEKIALASDKFVKNIPNRGKDIIAARKREAIKHDFLKGKTDRKIESFTDMNIFMRQTDDRASLVSAAHEQMTSGVTPLVRSGSSLIAKLKAKTVGRSMLSEQYDHFADVCEKSIAAEAMAAAAENEDYLNEEEELEHELLLAAEHDKMERTRRLAKRRQTRALLQIEALGIATTSPSAVAGESSGRGLCSLEESREDEEDHDTPHEVEEGRNGSGAYVTLPAIVVERNGKTITYPSVCVPKYKEVSENDDTASDSDDDSRNTSSSLNLPPWSCNVELIAKKMKRRNPPKSKQGILSRKVLGGLKMNRESAHGEESAASTQEIVMDKRTQQLTLNRRKLRVLLKAQDVSADAKAVRLMASVLDMMAPYWLRAKHVAVLLKHFDGMVKVEKYWGSYRVDMVVSLFSRIVDVHNFELILEQLSPVDAGSLYMRLGWLNIFNPLKIEGSYELEMGRWEERMVAKIIISVAMREPGENIIYGSFQWDRGTEKTPAWVVTQSWLSDDSMARKGYLGLTYASKDNCPATETTDFHPDVKYRRALLCCVLVREEELRREESWDTAPTTPGKDILPEMKSYVLGYLYGDQDVENKVTKLMTKKSMKEE